MPKDTKFDCWSCEYRQYLPGSAHIACDHPSIGERPPMEKLFAILAGVGRVPPMVGTTPELNIVGDPHGISHGWFNWPHNFDPSWLKNCDGYQKCKEAENAKDRRPAATTNRRAPSIRGAAPRSRGP